MAALYLHGGPGGGLGHGGYRNRFDPDRFRIIGIDQRGCGRSTPSAASAGYDLSQNTTDHLICDIEAVRDQLGIEALVLNGVSWGSTLALAYAQAHPARVLELIIDEGDGHGGSSMVDAWVSANSRLGAMLGR